MGWCLLSRGRGGGALKPVQRLPHCPGSLRDKKDKVSALVHQREQGEALSHRETFQMHHEDLGDWTTSQVPNPCGAFESFLTSDSGLESDIYSAKVHF